MEEDKKGCPGGVQEAGRPDGGAVLKVRQESLKMYAAQRKPERAPSPPEKGGIFLDDIAL